MEKCIDYLADLYKGIHLGRADPDLLNCVKVQLEQDWLPIHHVSFISTISRHALKVQAYDRDWLKHIEKAINDAKLGVTTDRTPDSVLVKLPTPTGERRQELAKIAKDLAEKQKIAIRNLRRDARTALPDQDKAIEKMTKEYISQIEAMLKSKQEEIVPSSLL